MKKIIILSLLFIGVLDSYAQEEAKPAPSKENVAAIHYARIYQRALRYNDVNAAKNALYNLVGMYPQNDSLLYSLSVLYFQTQQYASAALVSRDVLSINPAHSGALEISAVSFDQLGAKDKAIESYEQLYLKHDDYQSLYKMAFLQYDLGRYNEAMTNTDILLKRKESEELTVTYTDENNQAKEFPIKASLYNLKGLIAKESKNIEQARSYFNQALEIAPEFSLAKENLDSLNK